MNEYREFAEFETDLRLFYNYYQENAPKTVHRDKAITEFLQRACSDGAGFFLKQASHESEIQRTLGSELKSKLE